MAGDARQHLVPWVAVLAMALTASPLLAQMTGDPTSNRLPPQLSDVSIEQRLNQQVPLQATFRDENGRTVTLGDFFRPGKPVVLSLVYYNCQMLCSQVLSSMANALRLVRFDAGKDFEIVTVSFDPRETPAQAREAKTKYLAMYQHPGAAQGWHFLTGDQPSISALSNAVGFHYRWDQRTKQFAHATGIMLITPEGRVAQYYYGARYFPSDLRLGLVQTSQDHIGTLADQIVLYCYHWDPRTGRYGAIVSRVIQLSGGITLLMVAGFIIFFVRTDPHRRRKPKPELVSVGHRETSSDSGSKERRRAGDD